MLNIYTNYYDSQVDYAIKCIRLMKKEGWAAIEPKESAQEEFSANLQEKFKGTVWTTGRHDHRFLGASVYLTPVLGCNSWYLNEAGQVRVELKFQHNLLVLRSTTYLTDMVFVVWHCCCILVAITSSDCC